MKCTTLGVTTALASAAAGTVGAGAAPGEAGRSPSLPVWPRASNSSPVTSCGTPTAPSTCVSTGPSTADLYGASSAQHAAVDRAQPAVK